MQDEDAKLIMHPAAEYLLNMDILVNGRESFLFDCDAHPLGGRYRDEMWRWLTMPELRYVAEQDFTNYGLHDSHILDRVDSTGAPLE